MAIIRIENLRLRTIIGTFDWERENKQDIIINAAIEFDASKAAESDSIEDTVDYKTMTKKIITEVEKSEFFLIEKLSNMILEIIMKNEKVDHACVRLDKPFALRFADTVSIEVERAR